MPVADHPRLPTTHAHRQIRKLAPAVSTIIVTVSSVYRSRLPPARQAGSGTAGTHGGQRGRPAAAWAAGLGAGSAGRGGAGPRTTASAAAADHPDAYIGRSAAMASRPRGEQVWDVSGRRDGPAPRSYSRRSATGSGCRWGRVSGPIRTAPTCSPSTAAWPAQSATWVGGTTPLSRVTRRGEFRAAYGSARCRWNRPGLLVHDARRTCSRPSAP